MSIIWIPFPCCAFQLFCFSSWRRVPRLLSSSTKSLVSSSLTPSVAHGAGVNSSSSLSWCGRAITAASPVLDDTSSMYARRQPFSPDLLSWLFLYRSRWCITCTFASNGSMANATSGGVAPTFSARYLALSSFSGRASTSSCVVEAFLPPAATTWRLRSWATVPGDLHSPRCLPAPKSSSARSAPASARVSWPPRASSSLSEAVFPDSEASSSLAPFREPALVVPSSLLGSCELACVPRAARALGAMSRSFVVSSPSVKTKLAIQKRLLWRRLPF
mmetsp:Transcript_17313/g.29845  ORF Transcript_17313/g.29845 Transcript_17313/m.29845 type:complete len:275 (-) Transcript_17313:27-851(-)